MKVTISHHEARILGKGSFHLIKLGFIKVAATISIVEEISDTKIEHSLIFPFRSCSVKWRSYAFIRAVTRVWAIDKRAACTVE